MPPVSDLATLLSTMNPVLNTGVYVYVLAQEGLPLDAAQVVASVREPEGLSLIVEESCAQALGLEPFFRCAWITLHVNSDLAAVGLTAAFSAALGRVGISCNVVAGLNHDHIFVPVDDAAPALEALRRLQRGLD